MVGEDGWRNRFGLSRGNTWRWIGEGVWEEGEMTVQGRWLSVEEGCANPELFMTIPNPSHTLQFTSSVHLPSRQALPSNYPQANAPIAGSNASLRCAMAPREFQRLLAARLSRAPAPRRAATPDTRASHFGATASPLRRDPFPSHASRSEIRARRTTDSARQDTRAPASNPAETLGPLASIGGMGTRRGCMPIPPNREAP